MKVCPTCSEVYNDDDINFCLADGTTLLKKKGSKAAKHSHWNDVVAIILAAVAVLVFLCLVTSSADDRSVISTGGIDMFAMRKLALVSLELPPFLAQKVGVNPSVETNRYWHTCRSMIFLSQSTVFPSD